VDSPTSETGAALLSDLEAADDALDPPYDLARARELHESASASMELLSGEATRAILRTGKASDHLSRTSLLWRRLRRERLTKSTTSDVADDI
jgi:hypothetical protein